MNDPEAEDRDSRPPVHHVSLSELQEWNNDELDDDEALRVEHHLLNCEACALALDEIPSPDDEIIHLLGNQRDSPKTEPSKHQSSMSSVLDTHVQRAAGNTAVSNDDEAFTLPANPLVPQNRWNPIRVLATGGVGEIWLAEDRLFRRKVALKRIRDEVSQIPSVQQRFLREARITAELTHPGTAYVLDLHEAGPQSFYVMSLVQGVTLHSLIAQYHERRQAQSPSASGDLTKLLNHFVAVANTIAFAHINDIIHRDIKSENVIVGDFGQTTVVDWGLAKRSGDCEIEASDADLTSAQGPYDSVTRIGARVGTPAFMAPEQVRGENNTLDHRTDIYGLSAMLFEIVTGKPPVSGTGIDGIYDAVLTKIPDRFADHGVFSMDRIEQVCMRGLSKRPEDRPGSVSEIADVVSTWIADVVQRKRNEAERERFFSMTSDVMALIEDDRGIRWANPAWEHELGWKPEELVGKTHVDLVHPDFFDEVYEKLHRLRSGGSIANIEPRMRCKSGSYKWFLWTAARVPGENLTYVIGRNIDDRRRREDTRMTLLDGAPDALVVIDTERVIRFVNTRTEQLFGYQKDQMLGQRLEMLIPERFHHSHPAQVAGYAQEPEVRTLDESLELVALRNDGVEVAVRISLSPVTTADGVFVVSAVRPIGPSSNPNASTKSI